MSPLPKEGFCILVKSWCQLERRIINSQRLHTKQGHCQCNKDDGQQYVWQTSSPVSPGVVKPLHQNGNYLCKNKTGSTYTWGPCKWDICVTKTKQKTNFWQTRKIKLTLFVLHFKIQITIAFLTEKRNYKNLKCSPGWSSMNLSPHTIINN